MSACWPLQMSPAQKGVLISLADNANDDGVCWPSIRAISVRCCLSERAVQNAIKWLEEHHALKRNERSQKSTVYTITPDLFDGESVKSSHYVYRITHQPSGRFYIGLRTSSIAPERDPYFGSGACAAWLEARKVECKKVVLAVFASRRDAAEFEHLEVSAALDDPLCLNRRAVSPNSDGAAAHLGAGDAPAPSAGAKSAPSTPKDVRPAPAAGAPGTVIEPSIEPPTKSRASKGSRLPSDWVLPDDWRDWALTERPDWNLAHVCKVADTFRDFWIAKSGANACKLDWLATWRNWVRNEKRGYFNGGRPAAGGRHHDLATKDYGDADVSVGGL